MGGNWGAEQRSRTRGAAALKPAAASCRQHPGPAPHTYTPRQAWRLAGDHYATHAGDKPWISEMYGYAFGAAKAGVWHAWDDTSMIYPSYEPGGASHVSRFQLF